MTSTDPNMWLLQLPSKGHNTANNTEPPWGDRAVMAACEVGPNAKRWDENCTVAPVIDGYEAMASMRVDLEKAIGFTLSRTTPRGRVVTSMLLTA